jgi:hypothetical protein
MPYIDMGSLNQSRYPGLLVSPSRQVPAGVVWVLRVSEGVVLIPRGFAILTTWHSDWKYLKLADMHT